MPINPFDDALDQLDDATPAASAPMPETSTYDRAIEVLDRWPARRDLVNPFLEDADEMARGRTVALRGSLIQATQSKVTPDRQAEILALARRLRVPPEVVARNFDAYQQTDVLNQSDALHRAAPHLARWLSEPRHATVAHDDLPQLSALERSFEVGRNVVGAAGAGVMGFSEGVWGLVQSAAEAAGAADVADFARGSAIVASHVAARSRGPQARAGFVERNIYGGIESIGQMASGIVAGVTTGPAALLGVAGLSTYGQSYAEARRQGAVPETARLYGGVQGAIEVVTELIPAHRLLGDLGKRLPLLQIIQHQIVPEVVGEELATAFQDLTSWALLPDNQAKTFRDYLDERPSAAAATLVSTLTTVGVQSGLTHTAARVLDHVSGAAKDSKTVRRDPQSAATLIDQQAGEALKTVYLPADTFERYWRERGEDPHDRAAQLTGRVTALADAQQSGEDLAVPMGAYVTQIGTSEHHAFFRDEARLDPNGPNSHDDRSVLDAALTGTPAAAMTIDPEAVRARLEQAGASPEVAALSTAAVSDAQAFATVRPLFETAEAAGMSPERFSLYQQTAADVPRLAEQQLDADLRADIERYTSEEMQRQRAAIREEVAADVAQQPVHIARAAILNGTQPDGSPLSGDGPVPMPLSRQAITERYGADRAKGLPKGATTRKADGLDPDHAAELFGFSSGDELLTALSTAPDIATAVESETERRMFATHGSVITDGTLPERAQLATANDAAENLVRSEIRALGRMRRQVRAETKAERAYERRWFEAETKLRIAIAEGHKQVEIDRLQDEVSRLRREARGGAARIEAAMPSAAQLREEAKARIERMRVDEIQPQVFWSASRRAAQKAVAFAARQQIDEAIAAKTQELRSVALFREAMRVKADVEARVAKAQSLDSPKVQQRLGLAGGTYLDQILGILDRYSFARISQKALERRARIKDWIESLQGQGIPVENLPPEVLDDARRIHYRTITYRELVGITDGIDQILHLANLKRRLLKSQARREYVAVRDELTASIAQHGTARPRQLEVGPSDAAWRTVSDWYASHVKLADLAQSMDGGREGGPMWEAFVRPVNDAANAEETRLREAGKAYAALLEQYYPGRALARLTQKRHITAINGSLSKEAILALAQNQGTESNKARLVSDSYRKFTQPQIDAILDTLDKRDWDFVQAHWDYLETYWSEIAAKMQRVTGVAPEKVAATPVVTKFGTYRGGYHPLKADGRLSPQAAQHDLATQAKLGESAAYLRATTRRGHEQARVEHADYPVRLELGVTFEHLSQVIHDLTHHEMLIDTTRLLRDPKVRQAIVETQGDIVYGKFSRWLQDIALGDTSGGGKPTIADKAATFMRTRTQVMAMAWNVWSAMQQPLGIFNGMSRVGGTDGASNGVYWVSKGLSRWLRDAASLENTVSWIREVSPMMAARFGNETGTQDLRDLRTSFSQRGGWFDSLLRTVTLDRVTQQALTESFLWHIGMAQRVADVPTWLGMYEKQRANGETETRAIALADQAVLDSQGGGQVKDLAEIQRGGPIAKLFMSFASYGVTVLNSNARAHRQTNFRSAGSALSFLGHLTLLNVMPALGIVAMRRALFGGGDDDERGWIEALGAEMLGSALNGIIFVRELSGAAQLALGLDTSGGRGYGGPAGLRPLKLAYDVATQVQQGEADTAAGKAAVAAAGFLLKFPSTQVQKTIDGWVALEEGRTSNPVALIVGPPRKTP